MGQQLTGYPSVDKPWLRFYKPDAEKAALDIPTGKTVWDVIEEKLIQYKDIPAIEYFGRKISRPKFIDMVYTWAKVFKALGVKEDEVIPYYGPFLPDVGAIAFALNIIGACPYFLKLAISPQALAEETKESRFAIVYSDMWPNVSGEFSKDRFEKIIFVTVPDAMLTPIREFVALHGKLHRKKAASIPAGDKYLRITSAKKLAAGYHGEVRVPFVPDRPSFITSSSGTTVGGVVKGCVATNESTITQLYMSDVSEVQYFPGDKCLSNFPPTASTALDCLFILPLFRGMTVLLDPRISEKDFYNQLTKFKPNFVIMTGSMWETFFNRFSSEIESGKKFDLSFIKAWVVGGEGTDMNKFKRWGKIVSDAGGVALASGYGSSELFSAACSEKHDVRYDFSNKIVSVGIPYAGITVGVFDQSGRELGYHQRGELWINSKSAMKCYYNKPQLTDETLIDGWIHTGDLAEIDENGFVYIWGRCKDTVVTSTGQEFYLFDIAFKITEKEYIDDAIVLPALNQEQTGKLVAHIVWADTVSESDKIADLMDLNDTLQSYLPKPLSLCAYAEHHGMLPYSPTTLKKDKNKLSKQVDGYCQVVNGKMESISFAK